MTANRDWGVGGVLAAGGTMPPRRVAVAANCRRDLIQMPNIFERAARKRHDRFLCSVRQYVELDRRDIGW